MYARKPLAIRAAMGLSIRRFAKLVGVNKSTVNAWEQRRRNPSNLAARKLHSIENSFHRSQNLRNNIRVSYVNPEKLAYYTGKPGTPWRTWTWKRRLSFMAIRKKYETIIAEAQAGRRIIEYRVPKAKKP